MWAWIVAWGTLLALDAGPDPAVDKAIVAVRNVGPDAKGVAEAQQAWAVLARCDVDRLPHLLAGMDGANALARNWLRSAIDEVLARARREKKPLPLAELDRFLADTKHHPQARRLAYELIVENDKSASERYLARFTNDPSPDLRRDAVAKLLNDADNALAADAVPLYQNALACARDRVQIDKAAKRLRELGHPVDLPRHLGLLTDWKLIGPFSNKDLKGMAAVYEPEKALDLKAEYGGLEGKVKWSDHVSKDDNGIIDLAVGVGKHKEGIAYATTEFTSADNREVDIRIGCYTAFKLWVNGELVLDRADAYTGMKLDHYIAKARLKAGKNTILMKVAQQEPPGPVPPLWRFQLRVCDANGVAILSTTRPPSAPAEKKS